ncbi:uncharacterized protein PAC_19980 [Phialocephala subalpina]|uniref:Uncharacterized protein n=1 Tax=Phialocephala subalpina TaxID=576137 RepID=A0A1L7XYJ0_9HELO|nr:uncharacterized protein PAC_19980 [Phialocephala subalpina]
MASRSTVRLHDASMKEEKVGSPELLKDVVIAHTVSLSEGARGEMRELQDGGEGVYDTEEQGEAEQFDDACGQVEDEQVDAEEPNGEKFSDERPNEKEINEESDEQGPAVEEPVEEEFVEQEHSSVEEWLLHVMVACTTGLGIVGPCARIRSPTIVGVSPREDIASKQAQTADS